ncbi:hypothetical protein LTS14_001917 [Recurvomyces mirabilis]|uniref:uncharacterized protein n=1 Tax=Recurvomyces mirabilis TaxID=574656 RepID=UPI002DE1DFE7|nr:hypothetical protein LTS14_001917 [Recurvomyces mirabilis]
MADERGLIQTLHASPAGLHVYEKCGFRVVETSEMDLRLWGVEEVEVRRYMTRDAKGKGEGEGV